IQELGLRPNAVHDIGYFETSRTWRALEHATDDPAADGARIRYVSDHGFRGLGLVAMFDQSEAVELGERLRKWLVDAGSPAWPLAYATAAVPQAPEWYAADSGWERLAGELAREPETAPRELASCLLPASMQPTMHGHGVHGTVWNTHRPPPRWSRQAL